MPAASGIETTLRTLLRSANPAATDLLVADGGVRAIAADQIAEWCDDGFNFVMPPQ